MALSKIEEFRLQSLERRLGEFMPSSAEEALELAIQAEEFKVSVGAFDQAFAHFAEQQRKFFDCAELLEKRDQV